MTGDRSASRPVPGQTGNQDGDRQLSMADRSIAEWIWIDRRAMRRHGEEATARAFDECHCGSRARGVF